MDDVLGSQVREVVRWRGGESERRRKRGELIKDWRRIKREKRYESKGGWM
jgi:hypothetical protein